MFRKTMLRKLLFSLALLGIVASTNTSTASAIHFYRSYNYGNSFHGGYRTSFYGGFARTHYPRHHAYFHDTSHYDYHPPSFQRHWNHFDYVPGHYDYHPTGHWHH